MYYHIDEIKLAALDVMMEDHELGVSGLPFLEALLAKLTKPESVETAPAAVAEPVVTEPEVSEPEKPVVEAEKAETPKADATKQDAPAMQVYYGPQALMKREIYKALQARRAQGITSGAISKLTRGKVTPDEVLEIIAGAKLPWTKWEALAKALGVEAVA